MSLMIGVPFYALNKPPELIGQEIMRRAQSMIIVNKMQYCACILRCKPNAVLELIYYQLFLNIALFKKIVLNYMDLIF